MKYLKSIFFGFLLASSMFVYSQTYPYVIPNKDYVVNVLNNSGLDAQGVASAVDYASGAVYTCGFVNAASTGRDLVLVKFDSTGVQQWIATYDFNSLDDRARALYVDGSGNVFVTGFSEAASGNKDIVTIKYNSSGTQQWASRFNGSNNTDDEGNDILVDGSGNVWVCGYATITSKGKDYQILKYNSSGTLLSQPKRSGNANLDDIAEKMTISGTNLFVTGLVKSTTTNGDIHTICLNTTSVTLTWSLSVNGSANSDDSGYDIRVDNGDVYVCGKIHNTTTNSDYYFARLNQTTGATKYSNNYDGGYNGTDYATSLIPDGLGKYAITGIVANGSNTEYHTRLYDTSVVLWTHTQAVNGSYTAILPKIATDTIAQHFYVCGTYSNTTLQGLLYQLTPSGTKSWTQYHDGNTSGKDGFLDLVLDGVGRIYLPLATETSTANVYDYKLVRYSQTPVYLPPNYNMASDTFSFAHLFYPNTGEIVDTSRSSVDEVLYYTKFSDPMEFIQKNKVSFCHYKHDTDKTSPSDTITRIDMSFVGANEFSELFPIDFQSTAKLNYFLEYTGSSGLTNVLGARQLICPNIYPMIDLHFSSNANGAKYYFVVKPTGDPSNIQLYFDGAVSTSTVGGDLKVVSELEEWYFKKPTIYNVSVASFTNLSITTTSVTGTNGWTDLGGNNYKINPGTYNSAWPLVIEIDRGKLASPMTIQNIKWSTYLGSGSDDWVWEEKCDLDNNLIVVGETFATAFPQAVGATVYDPSFNGGTGLSDGFVAKFDTIGKLLWSTYVGGARTDYLKDLAFASNKDIYCVGSTNSASLPLSTPSGGYSQNFVGPFQSGFGYKYDGLIFVIKQDGLTNPWLTYYAGNSDDYFYGCELDANDNLFVVGGTKSTNLSVSGSGGAYTSNYNRINSAFTSCDSCAFDGYIVKFNSSSALAWSTYIGSDTILNPTYNDGNDMLYDICIEDAAETPPQEIFVIGFAGSPNYPTMTNGSSTNHNYKSRKDIVLTEFSNTGAMIYSSYFGTSYIDYGNAITYKSRKIYLTGFVSDSDFQTDSSGNYYFQRYKGLNDAFYIVMNANTNIVLHSSYLGGTNNDEGMDVVVDNNNVIYFSGQTESSNFPIPASQPANTYFHTYRGNRDNFICALEYSNQDLDWATFLGGNSYEAAVYDARNATICIDNRNNLFLGGSTRSDSAAKFPLDNGGGFPTFFEPGKKGIWDGTITKFDLIPLLTIGVKENLLKFESLNVFPNPASNYLYVRLKSGVEKVDYRIYDVTGKLVGFGKLFSNFNNIQVSNLTEGLYFLEVYDANNKVTTKFIKHD